MPLIQNSAARKDVFTMETEVKLTKLASCAGCGAKVGAGTLARLLDGFRTHTDPRLIVGYDKSDDASVYVLDENTALVQTTDFFPPIVDDPFLFGQIAAANALSDVYAMGGEPKLALNIMCLAPGMAKETVQDILRGGYDKAYEAGAIITGGHTIQGAEPLYGLAVSGFVHPKKVLTNSGAQPGDVLLLTKPLGVGIITTAAKAGLAEKALTTSTDLPSQTMFICHGDCYDDAKFVADYIRERSKVQDVIINYVGPVIGSHTGPGVVSVFFLGTER